MMGELPPDQNNLFYDFCLDQHVPPDHLLRQISQVLDLGDLRQHLRSYYSHTGRPSIDPELMIRMLIVGYCYGIRSERRLCEEVHLNLAYRWFCGLGLEDEVPNHSTFSKNRHGRFRDSDTLRFLFEEVVRRCVVEGLVGGQGFATDASIIKADANRQKGIPVGEGVNWEPEQVTRPVREYLEALDGTYDGIATPKNISLTDPHARWTAAPGGPAFYAYSDNYLIDIEHNIILDVEPTPAHRALEVESTKLMLDRVEDKLDIKPDRLIGDTAYGTAPMLEWMVKDKGIEPHVPVWDKAANNIDIFNRSDFIWDDAADCYHCPDGQSLLARRRNFKEARGATVTVDKTIIYSASQHDCRDCNLKSQCCPNTTHRKIARSIYEDSRDVARAISQTPEYLQSRRDRKKIEILFAHLKRILKLDRLRLRGLTGARDEFLMAATVQNLKKLAKLRYKPPDERIGAPVLC
jgi:transposase